jgi:hypothetical protein
LKGRRAMSGHIVDVIRFPVWLVKWLKLRGVKKPLADRLGAEASEEVLKLLLRWVAFAYTVWPGFWKHLKGFKMQYQFATDLDPSFNVALICRHRWMSVREEWLGPPNVRIDFRDWRAVIDLLTHPEADLVNEMLNQRIRVTGNLNYVFKLGYMLRHLLKALKIENK